MALGRVRIRDHEVGLPDDQYIDCVMIQWACRLALHQARGPVATPHLDAMTGRD